jgi:hypothetical protein
LKKNCIVETAPAIDGSGNLLLAVCLSRYVRYSTIYTVLSLRLRLPVYAF